MEIEDGVIRVYGVGEDGVLAFTDFGIESLIELTKMLQRRSYAAQALRSAIMTSMRPTPLPRRRTVFTMKRFLLATVALATIGAPAFAADLAYKAPPPIAAPLFAWTGFYIGANAGIGGDKVDYPFTALGVPGSLDVTSFGGFAGGQIGYNYQFGSGSGVVIGVEADAQWSNIRSEVNANIGGLGALNAGTEVEWFGTVRGRLGYAFDRILVYGTGGYAYGSENTFLNVTPGILNFSRSADLSGWTAGGGVEYAVTNNLSLKTEYLYFQFDRDNVFTSGVPPVVIDNEVQMHTIKFGLNYAFR